MSDIEGSGDTPMRKYPETIEPKKEISRQGFDTPAPKKIPRTTAILDTASVSSIAKSSKACATLYERLRTALQEVPLRDSTSRGFDYLQSLDATVDAQARFRAWAVGIAALQPERLESSLDFRLTNAKDVRQRILNILEDLQDSLNEATLIVSGSSPNDTWEITAPGENSQNSNNVENIRTSELEQLLLAIKNANSSLMKLSIIIRNSPRRDDYAKAASRYNIDSRYDIGHVREKHGSAEGAHDWLLERLGKAITGRRQYLKYREDHHAKLSRDWEDTPSDHESKHDRKAEKSVALTKATSFYEEKMAHGLERPDLADSLGSKTSYEATEAGNEASGNLIVPRPPEMAFEGVLFEYGEPFQCPYCYTEQEVKSKTAWKKHVFRDLKPYVCTFEECDLRMFRSRNEWFVHELQAHRREWICELCTHKPFATAALFKSHLKNRHPSTLKSSQLEAMVLRGEEPVDRISADACRLCDQWKGQIQSTSSHLEMKNSKSGSTKQFRRHLGRHMEQLALFALPLDGGGEGGVDSSDEDEHSDSVNEDGGREGASGLLPIKRGSAMEGNFPRDGHSRGTYFIDGGGIDREVITTDIAMYLGKDALVKPGIYKYPTTGEVQKGYYITADRALTPEQLASLRADSSRRAKELDRQRALRSPQLSYAGQANSRWWKCCRCSREIYEARYELSLCPDCSHDRCGECTYIFDYK